MDIIDVELFLKIVESHSISSAADQLHYSQSTVSYRLKCLEKEVGVQDILEVIFGAKNGEGALVTELTASQCMFQILKTIMAVNHP